MVCNQEYWSNHGTSLFMIGLNLLNNIIFYSFLAGMITTPILVHLADNYGRRFTYLIPLWITVLSNIACSLAPSYLFFLTFRFLAGLGTAVSFVFFNVLKLFYFFLLRALLQLVLL